jgi:hypothetical protein
MKRKKEVKKENINGNDITEVYTLKSWYDNNCVAVYVENKKYYITGYELQKVLKLHKFTAELARTRTYLTFVE